jgi:hypothetical protein
MKQNVMNTENEIKVSGINEAQALNLMKNVANIVMELELNYGDLDEGDQRAEQVEQARESLHNAMRALGVLHAYEVETSAKIKADMTKEIEKNAKK